MSDNNAHLNLNETAAAATAVQATPEQLALLEKVQREQKVAKRKGLIKGIAKGLAIVVGSAAAGAGLAMAWNHYSEQ